MDRSRPEFLEYDAASMFDSIIVKATDNEGFLKKAEYPYLPSRILRSANRAVRFLTLDPGTGMVTDI
jgi:hypothetical protein